MIEQINKDKNKIKDSTIASEISDGLKKIRKD